MDFNEFEYLIANPDVALAINRGVISSGWEHYQNFGQYEDRPLCDPNKSRKFKALHNLNTNGLGLEIGPSINPIAPKIDGYKIEILDHLSAQDLKEKYANHGVNISAIEEVDYVWSGEKISELIGKHFYYDWIIASHVIEHVPDFIGFLGECEKLLKRDGVLSLVIPDLRYCFDHLGLPATTGEILDARLDMLQEIMSDLRA